tara:strand:- start:284 stop:754 length:471 start_codon:yes stop_codon:yes gene_type:complete
MEPLRQWVCDKCGDLINSANEGVLQWTDYEAKDHRYYISTGFYIVHNNINCSFYKREEPVKDINLSEISGEIGILHMLSFFDKGIFIENQYPGLRLTNNDIRSLSEIWRRMQIPHYEEARLYYNEARMDGLLNGENEISMHTQRVLLKMIKKYRKS